MQFVLDSSVLTELYGKPCRTAGCEDEWRGSTVGEHPLRQGRREHSQNRQCLGNDNVQCVCINDHRAEGNCVLMTFSSCLKLRGCDIIFQEELGALTVKRYRRGKTQLDKMQTWFCRVIKTFPNKLRICCLCGFICESQNAHVLLI